MEYEVDGVKTKVWQKLVWKEVADDNFPNLYLSNKDMMFLVNWED